jgi:hypothetical protein
MLELCLHDRLEALSAREQAATRHAVVREDVRMELGEAAAAMQAVEATPLDETQIRAILKAAVTPKVRPCLRIQYLIYC